MIRIPDFYYTKQPLDGYYEPPGQLAPIEKFRGETIEFGIYFNVGKKPVTFQDWEITAFVKSNREACTILWTGQNSAGIYEGPNPGTFITRLSADDTRALIPGTYWLYTKATQRVGRGDDDYGELVLIQPPILFCIKETYDITDPKFTSDATDQQSAPKVFDITKI